MLDDSSLRRITRDVMANLDQKCRSRGGAHRRGVEKEVRRRVKKALGTHTDGVAEEVVSNLRAFLVDTGPDSRTEDGYRAAITVLAAATDAYSNKSAIADLLGVDRRAVAKGAKMRAEIKATGVFKLPMRRNGGARRFLHPDVRWAVFWWWVDNTRVSPIQRDAQREFHWLNRQGVLELRTGVQLQDRTDAKMWELFCNERPDLKLGFVSFRGVCKPVWVRHYTGRFVCLSVKDEQQKLLMDATRALVGQLVRANVPCICPPGSPACVRTLGPTLTHEASLRNSVLCAKADGCQWHNIKCVKGECDNCGCAVPLGGACAAFDDTPDARFRVYEKVLKPAVGTSPAKEKLELVQHTGTRRELLERLRKHTAMWIIHDFVGRWQMAAIKSCVKDLPTDTVFLSTDYAAQFDFEPRFHTQQESMEGTDHMQMLVFVAFRRDPADPTRTIREEHFFNCDGRGLRANWTVVQYALRQLVKKYREMGYTRFIGASDNCAAQYKSRHAFLGMVRLAQYWGSSVGFEWMYGGSERFKWVHDGAGGRAKAILRGGVLMNDSIICDAAAATAYLTAYESAGAPSSGSAKRDSLRVVSGRFYSLVPAAVLNSESTRADKPVAGTQKLHALRPTADGMLYTRELACGCGPCINRQHGQCENAAFTGVWKQVQLAAAQEHSPLDADDDMPYDVDSDVVVGDVVAVPACHGDPSKQPFHLLKVIKAPENLEAQVSNGCFKHANGRATSFRRGTRVVRCHWLPEVQPGVFERWDDAWVSNGKWAGPKPWKEVPLVVIATAEIKAVGVELAEAGADVRRRLKDTNPGQLFTVPAAELEDLLGTFEG